ncbi:hypothetical protein ACN20G_05200 [Streptomyces sp. BI20]|uniref:hypothetical protein n=1 Tax=Streptomyces sp. BI20 TaxID=3403460 RepID=UPI003C7555FA
MLALRLVTGSHPLVQARRLLVAAASAGSAFLLLYALVAAVDHPGGSFPRMLWALVPLAATVLFAVAVARTDPATRPRSGLDAAGLGPLHRTLIAGVSTGVACALGSVLALAVFLHLRGQVSGLPFDGAGADLLHADRPLPLAAALTLVSLPPLIGAGAAGLVLRPRPAPFEHPGEDGTTGPAPAERSPFALLPWGIAATAVGLAVEAAAGPSATGTLAGLLVTALGLTLVGPALVHAAGTLLQLHRPGTLRLLAGRTLREEAVRVGRPLGLLCAVAAVGITALLRPGLGVTGSAPLGPLTAPAAALVAGCVIATVLSTALEIRQTRDAARATLVEHGVPAATLRSAAVLRAAALLATGAPLAWGVAYLTSLTLTR